MSAGLDVAAGVAGVASLGINAIDVALKIRDVCKAVKNAPAEIRGLLQEAELFHAIILEYSRRITTVAPSALHETAIRNCERNFDLLYSSLQKLNAGLACKRNFWNSLKTMRKRETLEGLATKVERAKSSLVLVGLLHCMQYASSASLFWRSNANSIASHSRRRLVSKSETCGPYVQSSRAILRRA